MTTLQSWGELITASFSTLWLSFISFLPGFLSAVIIFIIGWFIAVILGKLANQIIKYLKVDQVLEKMNFDKPFERAGLKLDTARFFEELVKWFFVLMSLMVALDIVGLTQASDFLKQILYYIPQVIAAAIFLVVGILVANLLQKVVQASLEATNIKQSVILGTITKWAVLVFALFSALIQLGIATADILFIGFIAGLSIAFGLAFGLGGKDMAAEYLANLKKKMSEKS